MDGDDDDDDDPDHDPDDHDDDPDDDADDDESLLPQSQFPPPESQPRINVLSTGKIIMKLVLMSIFKVISTIMSIGKTLLQR